MTYDDINEPNNSLHRAAAGASFKCSALAFTVNTHTRPVTACYRALVCSQNDPTFFGLNTWIQIEIRKDSDIRTPERWPNMLQSFYGSFITLY